MKKKNYSFFGIGFLFLLVLILVYSYRGDNFETSRDEYKLQARFQNISGLRSGSSVLMSGVEVGRVGSFYLDPKDFKITVVMNIESDVQIPLDSFISVKSGGFFGEKFLSIAAGGDIEFLVAGDVFDFTQDAILFLDVMSRVLNAAESQN